MPSRRPSPSVDVERLAHRLESKIDETLGALLPEITALKVAVLRGQMTQEVFAQRLTDLEMQVIESRQHLQVSERAGVKAAQDIADTAVDTAKAVAKTAPRNVWKTKLGLITAGSAAFVAVVAFFNNLPKFVRGAAEIAVGVFQYVVRHK